MDKRYDISTPEYELKEIIAEDVLKDIDRIRDMVSEDKESGTEPEYSYDTVLDIVDTIKAKVSRGLSQMHILPSFYDRCLADGSEFPVNLVKVEEIKANEDDKLYDDTLTENDVVRYKVHIEVDKPYVTSYEMWMESLRVNDNPMPYYPHMPLYDDKEELIMDELKIITLEAVRDNTSDEHMKQYISEILDNEEEMDMER